MRTMTAYIEFDQETNLHVGVVPSIPGAHTQAATLDELQHNLQEVVELCLEEYGEELDNLPRPCPTILAGTWLVLCSERSSERSS
jgi:predicted RNase H-like HicB family nuclease